MVPPIQPPPLWRSPPWLIGAGVGLLVAILLPVTGYVFWVFSLLTLADWIVDAIAPNASAVDGGWKGIIWFISYSLPLTIVGGLLPTKHVKWAILMVVSIAVSSIWMIVSRPFGT